MENTMNSYLRIGGAQIPVTPDIGKNLITIKQSIDWAAENNVDYLVTPEASLSGYTPDSLDKNLSKLIESLGKIELYAKEKKVGLCLGTLWVESNGLRRNQIRYYTKDGIFIAASNKHIIIEQDIEAQIIANEMPAAILLPVGVDQNTLVGGLICVDFYGTHDKLGLPPTYRQINLMIHSTNGSRGEWLRNPEELELAEEITDLWHDINFRRHSFLGKRPIITVDNCYMSDGREYHGKTSSQSGVLINGRWVTNVPRFGTQYFYHDLDLENLIFTPPVDEFDNI
jgi:hypothetical protein